MKLSRTLPRLVASGLALALMMAATQSSSSKTNFGETLRLDRQKGVSEEAPKKVTVILHGLMVGRYWNGASDKRFEVGIVKAEKDHHRFSLSYYYPGVQRDCQPINTSDTRKLVFEVRRGNEPVTRNIELWHWQPQTPQTSLTFDENPLRDSSLILNLEGDRFYNEIPRRKNLNVLPKEIFKPVFHFHNGSVKTHTPTRPLLAKRPNVPCHNIGQIAEVVMVQIKVNRGEQLVLSAKKSGQVLWNRGWDEIVEGAEVRILNLEAGDYNDVDCTMPYDGCPRHSSSTKIELQDFLTEVQRTPRGDCDAEFPPTHFQLYYQLVFNKNERDRFELECPYPCHCYQVMKDGHPTGVPPYRCGMVLVSNKEIK